MYLKKISLLNFKNIAQEELALCPGINCLVGDNGAGKTNVVDAVYYLSMCKSSLAMTDGQSIRHGADFFLAEGQYLTDAGKTESVVCSFSRKGGKVLKRNGKEYERLSDHVGLIPAVIVSPADSALISDAADERRRYLNGFISQLDRTYLASVMRYNAVLAERNRLLKTAPDETMLRIYDMQLVEQGNRIHARRREFAERLQPVVAEYYRILSDDREQVELHYKSELNDRPFEEVLLAARQKDLANEFTTAGIHRDDLVLKIGGYPLRKYGSQGQQKSFLIALKLAQYAIVAEQKGEKPILLLDDLFDKLDAGRVEQLIRLVSADSFGQIVITDCNPTRLRTILDKAGGEYALFLVSEGGVRQGTGQTGHDTTAETAPPAAIPSHATKPAPGGDTPEATVPTPLSETPDEFGHDTNDTPAAETPDAVGQTASAADASAAGTSGQSYGDYGKAGTQTDAAPTETTEPTPLSETPDAIGQDVDEPSAAESPDTDGQTASDASAAGTSGQSYGDYGKAGTQTDAAPPAAIPPHATEPAPGGNTPEATEPTPLSETPDEFGHHTNDTPAAETPDAIGQDVDDPSAAESPDTDGQTATDAPSAETGGQASGKLMKTGAPAVAPPTEAKEQTTETEER